MRSKPARKSFLSAKLHSCLSSGDEADIKSSGTEVSDTDACFNSEEDVVEMPHRLPPQLLTPVKTLLDAPLSNVPQAPRKRKAAQVHFVAFFPFFLAII